MTAQLDEAFYRDKSWGAVAIQESRDLPTLKLRYLLDLLRTRNSSAATLLEVGSGSGRILASIQQHEPALRLTGVDLSVEQTELARSTHKGIEFVCANGESLPFGDSQFDYVVVFDYLEHIERPPQSLAEMCRVLRPGGLLYLVCPTEAQGIFWVSTQLFGRHFKEQTAGHIQQYSRNDLRTLLQQAGFLIQREKFSYHLLGSCMDYALFTAMLNKHVYRKFWTQNTYYAKSKQERTGGWFNFLLRAGNAVAYTESTLLSNIELFSAAMHITAEKQLAPVAQS